MRKEFSTSSKGKLCGLIAALALSPAVQADATLEIKDSSGVNDSLIQIKGDLVRMSQPGQAEYVLYDKSRDTAIHVTPAKKEYMEIDRATLEEFANSIAAMREKLAPLREQLKNLPPEQRAMMEQQMGGMLGLDAADGQPAAEISTVKRGGRSVAGFECDVYEVRNGKEQVAEVCLANEADGGMSKADFQTLNAMMTFMRDMARQAQKLAGGMLQGTPQFDLGDVQGVPVVMKDLKEGREFTLAGVSDSKLDGALFNAYKGYRKRDLPVMQ